MLLLRKVIKFACDKNNCIILLVDFKRISYDQIIVNNCFKDWFNFIWLCLFTCVGDFYKSVWIPIYGLFGNGILIGFCWKKIQLLWRFCVSCLIILSWSSLFRFPHNLENVENQLFYEATSNSWEIMVKNIKHLDKVEIFEDC